MAAANDGAERPSGGAANGAARGGEPRPLVAVPADLREFQGYRWHCAPEQYLRALVDVAGVTPVIVPALSALDPRAVLGGVDGVLVTGSRTNVHPALYGGEPTAAHEPFDPDRDALALPLIRASIAAAVPLFSICRGIQEMNVALGGTLATEIQEREGTDDHRMVPSDDPDTRFALRHPVVAGGVVGAIVGERPTVNSLHRQAIDALAPGLRVEARAPDGTIEAVAVEGAPALAIGVQWHPEYWAGSDEPSTALFRAFGDAVRARAASRRAGEPA